MSRTTNKWTAAEDDVLTRHVLETKRHGKAIDWAAAAATLPSRSNKDCRKRWYNTLMEGLRKGPWEENEDSKLREAVLIHGEHWPIVAAAIGTRSADQCAKRWHHFLNPKLDRSGWTEEEDRALLEATDQHGRAWKDLQRTKFQDRSTTNIKNRYVTLSKRNVSHRRNTSDSFPQRSRRGSQAIDHSVRNDSYVRPNSATMSFADLDTMAPLATTDGCFPSVDPSSTSASPSADNLFPHARLPSVDDLASQTSLAEHTSDGFVTTVDNSGQIRAFADFWADGDGLLEPTYDPNSANDSSDWVTATSSRDVFGSRSGSPSNAVGIPTHPQGHAHQGAAWPPGEHSSDSSPTCPGRNTFVLRVEDPSPMIITQVTSFLMQSQTKFRMEMR